MKVFVVFALLIAGAAGSLCDQDNTDLDAGEAYKNDIRWGANLIFGHCTSFNVDKLLFNSKKSCSHIFQEGLCFGQLVAHKYSGLDRAVSYGDLAEGVDNVISLGQTSCAHGRSCFESIKKAFKKCDRKAGFRQGVVDAVENAYRTYGEAYVKYLSEDESNTLIAEIATLMRSRFTSVEDVAQAIEEFVSDEIVSDAEVAFRELDNAAQEWCDSGCTQQSGDFFRGLFGHMHGSGCVDAKGYCGVCATRADEYLASNRIPCCLDGAIKKGIAAVEYVRNNYADEIQQIREYISDVLSEDAFQQAKDLRDRVAAQVDCLSASYDKIAARPECEVA